MPEEAECPRCYQEVEVYDLGAGRHFDLHDNLDGNECEGSSEPVPADD